MKKVFVVLILATLLWVGCEKIPLVVPPIPPTVTHTVLVSQTGKGTVNPDTLTKVVHGDPLTITATPNSGYTLYSLKVSSVGVEKEIAIDPTTSMFQYTLPEVKANTEVVFEFIETDNLIISIEEPPFRLKDISTFLSDGTYHHSSVLSEDDLTQTVYFYYPEGEMMIFRTDGSVYFSANWHLEERILTIGVTEYPVVELTPTKLVYKLQPQVNGNYLLYTYERN